MKKIQVLSILFLLAAVPAVCMKKTCGTSVAKLKKQGHCDLTIAVMLAHGTGSAVIDSTQKEYEYYEDLTNPTPELRAIYQFVKNLPGAIWKFTEISWLPAEALRYLNDKQKEKKE